MTKKCNFWSGLLLLIKPKNIFLPFLNVKISRRKRLSEIFNIQYIYSFLIILDGLYATHVNKKSKKKCLVKLEVIPVKYRRCTVGILK